MARLTDPQRAGRSSPRRAAVTQEQLDIRIARLASSVGNRGFTGLVARAREQNSQAGEVKLARSPQVGADRRAAEEEEQGRIRTGQHEGFDLELRVDLVESRAAGLRHRLAKAIDTALDKVDATQANLLEVAKVYEVAHRHVLETIHEAQESAALEEEKLHFVIEIGLGVAVGLSMGAALPMAEGASHAMEVAIETAKEAYKLELAEVVKHERRESPTEAEAERFAEAMPVLKNVEAYQQCGRLYRALAKLNGEFDSIGAVSDVAYQLKPDVHELSVTGKHRSLSISEIEKRVAALEKLSQAFSEAEAKVDGVIREVGEAATESALAAKEARDDRENTIHRMESQIWLQWLASRDTSDTDLVGEEAIRAALSRHGIRAEDAEDSDIGWGVGIYQSGADERAGVEKARDFVSVLKMVGAGGVIVEGEPMMLEAEQRLGDSHATERREVPGMIASIRLTLETIPRDAVVVGDVNPGDEVVVTGVLGARNTQFYEDGERRQLSGDVEKRMERGPLLVARPPGDAKNKNPWRLLHQL